MAHELFCHPTNYSSYSALFNLWINFYIVSSFYIVSQLLWAQRKNVNNDVSKDSPIQMVSAAATICVKKKTVLSVNAREIIPTNWYLFQRASCTSVAEARNLTTGSVALRSKYENLYGGKNDCLWTNEWERIQVKSANLTWVVCFFFPVWFQRIFFFLSIQMIRGEAASTRREEPYQTVSTVYFILGILRTDLCIGARVSLWPFYVFYMEPVFSL